ncbi:MAG: DUF348 domain-containing protein, partial [Chloroflexi bacterium]|nr:DUF348 domain-containing protein [Chloroflexota bacterium]
MWKNPRTLQFVILTSLGLALLAFYFGTGSTVSIDADGHRRAVTTHAATVGGALHDAGIEVLPQDVVTPPLTDPLRDGLRITIARSFQVEVRADGRAIDERVQGESVAAILANLQIELGPDDAVVADDRRLRPEVIRQQFVNPPRRIVVRRSVPFTVVDEGRSRGMASTAETVGDALTEDGMTVYLADLVTPALDARLTPGLTVTIRRSRPITIQLDGSTLNTRVSPDSQTVAQALAEAGVALVGLDYSVPAPDDPLPKDGPILVKRVVETLLSESAPIPFKTTYQPRPDLEIDNTVVVKNGQSGVAQRRVRVRYENGVEASRKTEQEWISQAPQDRIVGYGTNIVIRTLDTP